MMKIKLSYIKQAMSCSIFLAIAVGVVFYFDTPDAYAQRKNFPRHYRPSQVLEVSLMGLRESANQVARRNEWLLSEIGIFRKNIQMLESDLQSLDSGKFHTLDRMPVLEEPPGFGQEAASHIENKFNLLDREVNFLDQQQMQLHRKNTAKLRSEDEIYQVMDYLRQDIAQLHKEIAAKSTPEDFENRGSGAKNEDLKFLIEKSEDNLVSLRKELDRVQKKFGKPLKDFNTLYDQNSFLKEKLAISQDNYNKALAQEKKLTKELQEVKAQNEEYIAVLNKNMRKLESKQKKLEKVLKKAYRRIVQRDLDFTFNDEEFEQLMENLYVIKNENNMLKDEFFGLEDSLKSFKNDQISSN